MFAGRYRRRGARYTVDVAFTDRWGGVSTGPYESLDLTRDRAGATAELDANRALLSTGFDVEDFAVMRQVHGRDVRVVADAGAPVPVCDALVTATPALALCVRVADCVPLVLADVEVGLVAVAHVGRPGVTAGIVASTIAVLRDAGARSLEAWIGPHVCGGCYEVPAAMRADVSRLDPAAFGCTTWGSPSIDVGAAVVGQLHRNGCARIEESSLCTRESADLFSYRRQGASSGRQAGLVVLRENTRSGART